MQPVTSAHAPINDISMYHELYGEGSIPLVLLHGGGSTIQSSFGAILPMLAAGRRLLAVELQAHGRTTDRDAPESFDQDADDIAALLNHLHIDKADILGFSNGGTTTLRVAIRHPGLVNKIIPVAGAYQREGFVKGFFENMPFAELRNMPLPLHEAFLSVTPDRERLQNMFEKDKQRMIDFPDYPDDDLRGIKAPALFISEDRDVITPEHTLKMSRLVSGSKAAILPGTHGTWLSTLETGPGNEWKAAITAKLVHQFLSE